MNINICKTCGGIKSSKNAKCGKSCVKHRSDILKYTAVMKESKKSPQVDSDLKESCFSILNSDKCIENLSKKAPENTQLQDISKCVVEKESTKDGKEKKLSNHGKKLRKDFTEEEIAELMIPFHLHYLYNCCTFIDPLNKIFQGSQVA
tara:strand:- start:462 stop:905 length:444 start_codon:yes stop_codon:yes gene_type:complete